MKQYQKVKPDYEKITDWEFYASDVLTEYSQCIDEGLKVGDYKELFDAVAKLPKSEIKSDLGDVIYKIVCSAETDENYPYTEPNALDEIRALRQPHMLSGTVDEAGLEDKIHGAWLGRVCGCMLGKTVEGIRTDELIPFLKETGNYPMHRYILRSDLTEELCEKYRFGFKHREYADEIDGMPPDDDTNYVVLAQRIFEKYGRDFTPHDVARAWVDSQPKYAYCTAERVAFCNFVKGFEPPESAVYKNPYREWIGAQIRGDYWGYINPGNPEKAAELAWRDASISHVKNGIYGEMFAAAMIAAAAVTDKMEDIILAGLAEIPKTSRLYSDVMSIVDIYRQSRPAAEAFELVHSRYNEYTGHGWCHTNSNAMIVAAALLYGESDYGKTVCMAVETGFDTDCNAATAGSIVGMINGAKALPECWTAPINDTLHTAIFGVGTVKISAAAKKTMAHIKRMLEE